MGNLLATPKPTNYRRSLSGDNRIKAIKELDSESIDLFYVLYIYLILMLSVIGVIYLYSVKNYGQKIFPGDKNQPDTLWTKFIKFLKSSPADRKCSAIPTISVAAENIPEPPAPSTDLSCYPGGVAPQQADKDCII